jgi:hypothetical protein
VREANVLKTLFNEDQDAFYRNVGLTLRIVAPQVLGSLWARRRQRRGGADPSAPPQRR